MNKIIQGDCHEMLLEMPDKSIDMVMTSPPYWALRDYGVEGQLGLEPTFEEYIDRLCNIFDEVRRVLKSTGTCWVNIDDTYAGSGKGIGDMNSNKGIERNNYPGKRKTKVPNKSLCMVPERFAMEMIKRGWILRNTIIWHKPNAMPESVEDRFTDDFEYLYFFTKSKKYYFKQQLEPHKDISLQRYLRGVSENNKYATNGDKKLHGAAGLGKPRNNIKYTNQKYAGAGAGIQGHSGYLKADGTLLYNPDGRNKRTVWSIPTKSYGDAHFAVYPEELCKIPISAGCPEGGVVLDPFMGSGTTLKVARELGRRYIGIELNPEYIKLAEKRLAQQYMFAVE